MNRIKEKLRSFMIGRYGNDKLNFALLFLALALQIGSYFAGKFEVPLRWIGIIFLYLVIFRSYSRNIVARQRENQVYLNKTKPVRLGIKRFYRNIKDRDNKYISCPNCKQELRVPTKKGKIKVKCRKCNNVFEVRT